MRYRMKPVSATLAPFPAIGENVNISPLFYAHQTIFTRVLSLSECGNKPKSMVKRKLTNADGKILTSVSGTELRAETEWRSERCWEW